MKKFVVMSGGFHPFHAGHASLYQQAKEAFPDATVLVCATNVQKDRPFPFTLKKKLAQLSGVPPKDFIEVSRQFTIQDPALAKRIGDPNNAIVIYVRSDKDRNEEPQPWRLGPDGKPPIGKRGKPLSDYLIEYPGEGQPLDPATKHAYMAYLKTVEFGPGITSASEIRNSWPKLNDKRKLAMIYSLYPSTKDNPNLAQKVVQIFDQVMGTGVEEAANPAQQAAIAISMKEKHQEPKNEAVDSDSWYMDEEFLSKRTYQNVSKAVFAKLYPNAKVIVQGDDDGDGGFEILTQDQKYQLMLSVSRQEGCILVYVERAYAGEYKGVTGEIIQLLIAGAIKRWGRPPEGVILHPGDDVSGGYWPQLAQRLGVKYEAGTVYGEKVNEDGEGKVDKAIVNFYKPVLQDIQKEKVDNYVEQARELMSKTNDPTVKQKLLDIFKTGKTNPYLQGGIITTVGALLAGGVLNSAQSMGLSPTQTNLALQGILNTVIPTLVSRVNGKNWIDTIKYTLASAGVGTGIAAITESSNPDYLEEK